MFSTSGQQTFTTYSDESFSAEYFYESTSDDVDIR